MRNIERAAQRLLDWLFSVYDKTMPHLNTEPGGHDATVSAFIIRTDTAEPTLLLHRHKKLDQYLQFGGHIERNENPWQALAHEIAEESGYAMTQLHVLQPALCLGKLTGAQVHPLPVSYSTHKFPGIDHYHTDAAYAFIAESPPQSAVGAGESDKIVLFTANELRDIPGIEIPEDVRETGLFVLEKCLDIWTPVAAQAFK